MANILIDDEKANITILDGHTWTRLYHRAFIGGSEIWPEFSTTDKNFDDSVYGAVNIAFNGSLYLC